jgi:hypothetical protein
MIRAFPSISRLDDAFPLLKAAGNMHRAENVRLVNSVSCVLCAL